MLNQLLPSSPHIIDDILNIFHPSRVGSDVPPSRAAIDILGQVVDRLSLVLMGHQRVYLLLRLALAFEELSQHYSYLFRCQSAFGKHRGHWGCLADLLCDLLTLSWRYAFQSTELKQEKTVEFPQTSPN